MVMKYHLICGTSTGNQTLENYTYSYKYMKESAELLEVGKNYKTGVNVNVALL